MIFDLTLTQQERDILSYGLLEDLYHDYAKNHLANDLKQIVQMLEFASVFQYLMPPIEIHNSNGKELGEVATITGVTSNNVPFLAFEVNVDLGEPQPPGYLCPYCGNCDVDVDNGSFTCCDCGSQGEMQVGWTVTEFC